MFLYESERLEGIAFDKAGNPTTITPRAVENMGRLLSLAQEEEVVLIPVLLVRSSLLWHGLYAGRP